MEFKKTLNPHTIIMENERNTYSTVISSLMKLFKVNIHDAIYIEQYIFNNTAKQVNDINNIYTHTYILKNSRDLPSKP